MLDWSKYIKLANRYQYKARRQDREDLNHTIIVSLAEAQIRLDNNGGGQLSDLAMLRIASYRCKDYWRKEYRSGRVISLNTPIADGDGNQIELIDTLADDSVDIEAWFDRTVWELNFPDKLTQIVRKRLYGIPLNKKEQTYFTRHRHSKKRLI